MSQSESELQRQVRLTLGQKPDLVLWRNETGAYSEMCTVQWLRELLGVLDNSLGNGPSQRAAIAMLRDVLSKSNRYISYGLTKGSSDLIGILKPNGRFFALELKTLTGKVTEEQVMFIKLVNSMGGYAAVARTLAEAEFHYTRATEGFKGQTI